MMESLLILNPLARETAKLASDTAALHRFVMRAFREVTSDDARAALCVLHRLEVDRRSGALGLVVRSKERPDWSFVSPGTLCDIEGAANPRVVSLAPLFEGLMAGAAYRFRLRANPARKIDTKTGPDGVRRNGKRVPVRGHEARVAWLCRQASAAGFEVLRDTSNALMLDVREEGVRVGTRRVERVSHDAVLYEGVLRVVDPEAFRQALRDGMGRAKAFGFGLLSVTRVS